MVQRDDDAADVRLPPPVSYVVAVLAGVLLHLFVYPLDLALPMPVRIATAALCGCAGLALAGAAILAFLRTGQDPKPWKTTPEFIATGVYRLSRNPMYTGLALMQAGLAVALANGWILVLVPVVLCVIHTSAIRPEETYLAEKFGDSYRAYTSAVRRWL